MDDALSTLESAEDMTAADTAPSPKNETNCGVRCCKTRGKIIDVCSEVNSPSGVNGPLYAVSFQAVENIFFIINPSQRNFYVIFVNAVPRKSWCWFKFNTLAIPS